MADDLYIEGSDITADDFTERAWRAVTFARDAAVRLGSELVEPDQILHGLLNEDESLVSRFLLSSNGFSGVPENSDARKSSKQPSA
ncbi:MAG: Clp protease N-terminal domain-containing protein, partial [Pyrinomonadaceae bacterium]